MGDQHYDLVVIGGGSGGLACSKEAAKLGKKVAVCDFVKPSPPGTTWGLGGTCVNVGCIPKKLMHKAALLGEDINDSSDFGWQVEKNSVKHDWSTMVQNVQMHIKSLNFGYRAQLMSEQVKYFNAYAKFLGPNELHLTDKKGKESKITADKFVVAVGGRPSYPDIPGAKEHAITSDDIFSLKTAPGKTLVVGASYVALECAGFLHAVGMDTTVMVRSILLRGFDQQIAEMIGDYMTNHGMKFIRPATPTSIELVGDKKKVTWKNADGSTSEDLFDTVMFAIGRYAVTDGIDLPTAGVQVNPKTGKIPCVAEQTNVPHIYAIGDVLDGQPELTPVAIQAGRLLSQRLYAGATLQMDYDKIPTAVFTPLEYGAVGLSEEDAIAKIGKDNVEVYHSFFKPLEWTVPHREDNACYCKLVCDKTKNELVVGFHILGPNAGEITQGMGVAIKMNATKADLDNTVGIHPTTAEEFTTMNVTKSSGADAQKSGC